MKYNITLIGVNYGPEDSAIGLYSTQMMQYLAKENNIEVVTGFPYYPEWKIRKDYEDKPTFYTEVLDGITVHRYKQYVPEKPNFKKRVLLLLDFTFGSFRNIFKVKQSDLVICIVPLTTSILLGLILAKLRGAKTWVHIQDFEFDAAVESGLTGNDNFLKRFVFKGLFLLEKSLLCKADLVSTISYGMLEKLKTKTKTKNYFFPNWVDENFIDPSIANQHDLMTSPKFKVLYSGNIGAKQDWDFFIKLVHHFNANEHIEFTVVGAGAWKDWVILKTADLHNVTHYDPVAYATLPDLLCSADLHILFQKNNVVDTVMPSKLLGMMASGVPSIVTGNLQSEAAKVYEKSKGGYFYDSEAFEDVVESINTLSLDRSLCDTIGKDARRYITEHFSAEQVLQSFSKKIDSLIK